MGEAKDSFADGTDAADEIEFNVVSLLSPKVAEAVNAVTTHFRSLSESELIETTRPTDVDWKLRLSFWEKVREAQIKGTTSITTTSIYEGVMSRQAFFDMLGNPSRVAFFSRPVIEHEKLYEAINRVALAKIMRIVESAEIDVKYLPQILRLAEASGNRAYGAVAQKMQIQSKNLNVDVTASQLPPGEKQEDVQKQIDALQAKLIGAPRDVTPSED